MKKLPFILLLISGAALAIPSAGVLKLFKTAPATEKTKLPFSIRLLEKTLDERVFLSGPHTHQIKKSVNEFGHYNPLFLEKMKVLINQERVPTLAAAGLKYPGLRERFDEVVAARCDIKRSPEHFALFKKRYLKDVKAGVAFSSDYGWAEEYYTQDYPTSALAFWARRSVDGTVDLVEEILKDYLAMTEVDAQSSCLTAGKARYFLPDSYVDSARGGHPSLLKCRGGILSKVGHAAALKGRKKVIQLEESNPKKLKVRLQKAGCEQAQDIGKALYALYKDEGASATWEKVEGHYALEVAHQALARDSVRLVSLRFVGAEGAILLSHQKPSSLGPSSAHHLALPLAQKGTLESLSVGEGVDALTLKSKFKTWQSNDVPSPAERVLGRLTLTATIEKKSVVVEVNEGKGKRIYVKPEIKNVQIVDVDHDGHPDFLYEVSEGEKVLTLTRAGKVLRRVPLLPARNDDLAD